MKKNKSSKKADAKLPEFIDRIEIKHSFNDAEKATILTNLSRKHEEKEQLVGQMKSSAKQWKGKIDQVQLTINDLSMKGRDGYEMRPTEVRIVLDKKKKRKFIYAKDTQELIEEREMTDFDFERLPLDLPQSIKPGEGLANVGEALENASEEGDKSEKDSHAE